MDEELHYQWMVEAALRGVVFDSLKTVVDLGKLPGSHYFYVTFLTAYPGVQIPAYLREKHPREMTIVLQHGFAGFALTDDDFSVTLMFDDRPARVVIPIDAITIFSDPSKNFALQFTAGMMLAALEDESDDEDGDDEEKDQDDTSVKPAPGQGVVVSFDRLKGKSSDTQDK